MTPKISRSLVQNIDLLRSLSDEELDATLATAQVCRLLEGESAFRQGEPAESFFVLLSGHLKVVQVTPAGEQVVVRYVSPGEIFGIAQAMHRPNYPASAIAVQESLMLAWPGKEWDSLISKHPQFAAGAFQTVGQRLQDAHSRISALSTEEVEQRVARTILRLIDESGEKTEEGVAIGFPITRQDIAEMTGTTLHTVSRLLSAWKDQGIVVSGRKRITVQSVNDLIRLAEDGRTSNTPSATKAGR
ncbi:Crp/Fnr family transcriptional regulator [Allopusillimonas ginsengisoli]|uniref:Crp/Fnr family transcriptional regulator n=1 Tax=Allopusillimonas ginsengisoli TaxID=453575 RepID=UPI0010C19CC1|nr:Crp/Fnr family transcriptional regulator [Allopusillimonas ginsengisoli]